jgi:hypothetical protein
MSQNVAVGGLYNPKGIPYTVPAPSPNDWVMIQQDGNNRVGKVQLKNLGSETGGTGTATAVAGAATINFPAGIVTSEALTGATTYVLTLTNSLIKATSVVVFNVVESTGAAGPIDHSVVVTAGQAVFTVSMAALTGTLVFNFAVFN